MTKTEALMTRGTKVEGLYGRRGTIYAGFDKLRVAVVIYDDAPIHWDTGMQMGESTSFRDLRVVK